MTGSTKKDKLKEITSSQDTSLWRYLPLLPVGDPGFVGTSLRVAGGTPVLTPIKLGEELGIKKLWIKDEGRNPSASFKDRASAIVVARTRELKSEIVVTASTGNAGAALGLHGCCSGSAGDHFCTENRTTGEGSTTIDLWCPGDPGGWQL